MKIKISGVYGDEVSLYTDGYVYTKYGDFLKIKSVDVDSKTVHTYLGGSFDFSRISHSSKATKSVNKSYLENLITDFHDKGIRIGSELTFDGCKLKITSIVFPNMVDTFEPFLFVNTHIPIVIKDYDDFNRDYKIVEETIPYTLEEKITKILYKNTRGFNDVEIETTVKELMKLLS